MRRMDLLSGIKVLLIVFILLFLFMGYLIIFGLCKMVRKSDEDVEKMVWRNGDCLSCVWYQTKGCPFRAVYPVKNCPHFTPLIPFA
jgi:hypothetical protein